MSKVEYQNLPWVKYQNLEQKFKGRWEIGEKFLFATSEKLHIWGKVQTIY